jgi:hypothetical protein
MGRSMLRTSSTRAPQREGRLSGDNGTDVGGRRWVMTQGTPTGHGRAVRRTAAPQVRQAALPESRLRTWSRRHKRIPARGVGAASGAPGVGGQSQPGIRLPERAEDVPATAPIQVITGGSAMRSGYDVNARSCYPRPRNYPFTSLHAARLSPAMNRAIPRRHGRPVSGTHIGMVALGREVTEPSVGEEVGFEGVLGRVPRWPG